MPKPKSTPKPKVRDNTYWLARLERDHPDIHARLLAGDIPSVRAACAAAGLRRLPGHPSRATRSSARRWV